MSASTFRTSLIENVRRIVALKICYDDDLRVATSPSKSQIFFQHRCRILDKLVSGSRMQDSPNIVVFQHNLQH